MSSFRLFTTSQRGGAFVEEDISPVEDVLEKGLYEAGASPVHVAFRGTASGDSVRCEWRGVARTLEQREQAIRFWLELSDSDVLPSPDEAERRFVAEVGGAALPETAKSGFRIMARGGLSTDQLFMTCYIDYSAAEYLLGAGPSTLTAAYDRMGEMRSYDLYRRAHAAGEFGPVTSTGLASEEDYQSLLNQLARALEGMLQEAVGGRQGVVFLAPMGAHNAIAVEAWQAVAQWDVQTADDGTVNAVRYGAPEGDPEHTQTLANLKSRINTAAASDDYSDDRIANISGLTQYYRDIGAYGDITPGDGSTATFTPAQPPAPYAPAPATLTATSSGEDAVDLSWGSVTGATAYRLEHRESGEESWGTIEASVTGTTHTASGLWCARTHEFRVGAYGDGSTYNTRVGFWSSTASAMTDTCSPQPPRFEEDSYAFEVSAAATVGASVGTVSAVDVNGDTVAYSITAGNEAGKFGIDASTGEITVAGPLGSPVGTTFTLTAGAGDGVSGTNSVTVTITLGAISCSGGVVVPAPDGEPALVSDCEALLGLRDALAGTARLDWSLSTAIEDWAGVTVSGTPKRVTRINLATRRLTGVVPSGLSALTGLEDLALDRNSLTGEIPPELGDLVNLEELYLRYNSLTGEIPVELASLSSLTVLRLNGNDLTGGIPPELGDLTALQDLALAFNGLTGPIPPELGGLRRLRQLWLYDNELSGPIPYELGLLTNLRSLRISRNQFEGCIPPALRRISTNDLARLRLSNCTESGRVPAPSGLSVTLADGTFTITWSAVTGAAEYEAQHLLDGPDEEWASLPATSETTATYTPAVGPSCDTTYQFRVRAYGDASTYAAGWSVESAVESATGSCNRDPAFDSDSYDFQVREDAAVNHVAGTVSATDPDEGDTVSYSITAGNEDGKFALDGDTGEISVAATIDYETAPAYTLTVEASDGNGGTDTATVEIAVTDVAENPPPAPSGLGVTLADGAFTITWSAVTGAAKYEAQHRIGDVEWISLGETVETTSTYTPDGGPACGTTYDFRARAYGDGDTYTEMWGGESEPESVTTGSCNQDPAFDSDSYDFQVREDAAVDRVVGTVSATDADEGDTVSYSITGGNEDGQFAVASGTGEITVATALDYETTPSYAMTVQASDGNGGTDTATVQIAVTDVAENPPPAPTGLSVTLADGTFTITWSAISGAVRYEAQHRIGDEEWTALPETTETSATYTPDGGPDCSTEYEFRVRAYGDGDTYTEMWGVESAVETVETATCAPEFGQASYFFFIMDTAATDSAVGSVSATDLDTGDTVSYTVIAGNEDGKFSIDSATGQMTVAGAFDIAATPYYTLTVEASDGQGGKDTARVTVALTIAECRNGTAVPRHEELPRLVRDCSILLTAKDALRGTASLNWSADLSISEWQGIYRRNRTITDDDGMIVGQIAYVKDVIVSRLGLNGSIPPVLAGLADLRRLDLNDNQLTGEIPSEMGRLSRLRYLSLFGNRLTGEIPSGLGNLPNLEDLRLHRNQLTGEIPSELRGLGSLRILILNNNRLNGSIPSWTGELSELRQLWLRDNELTGSIPSELEGLDLEHLHLSGNSLSGCIPSGLRDVANNDLDRLGLSYCASESQ